MCAVLAQAGQIIGDRTVVLGGVHEDFLHQAEPEVQRRTTVASQFRQHFRVVVRTDDDEDVSEVLRRRAQQAGTADVDLLDQRIEGRVRILSGLAKRIEIDDDDVDRLDALVGDGREIVLAIAPGENAGMHRRMQRFHPAVQHLGEPRDVRHIEDRQARCRKRFRGPARGNQLDATVDEAAGKLDQATFVRHT